MTHSSGGRRKICGIEYLMWKLKRIGTLWQDAPSCQPHNAPKGWNTFLPSIFFSDNLWNPTIRLICDSDHKRHTSNTSHKYQDLYFDRPGCFPIMWKPFNCLNRGFALITGLHRYFCDWGKQSVTVEQYPGNPGHPANPGSDVDGVKMLNRD